MTHKNILRQIKLKQILKKISYMQVDALHGEIDCDVANKIEVMRREAAQLGFEFAMRQIFPNSPNDENSTCYIQIENYNP